MGLLDLFFPKKCLGCGKNSVYFCFDCRSKTRNAYQEKVSKGCLKGVYFLFAYEGIIKQAIYKLKYDLQTDIAKEFWELIKTKLEEKDSQKCFLEQFIKKEKPTVVPVPLYWYKQNVRGFNQSSIFGRKIAEYYDLPFSENLIIRRKNVISQTKLSRAEREKNVSGIFSISKFDKNLHKNILLVDDVWTTGSTMKEAAKILKRKGTKKVWGLTVAG